MHIAAANPASPHANQHLARTSRGSRHLRHFQLPVLRQQQCFHLPFKLDPNRTNPQTAPTLAHIQLSCVFHFRSFLFLTLPNTQEFLDQFRGPIDVEYPNVRIIASDTVAFSHGLERMTGTLKNGQKFDAWIRFTEGYRKTNGHWLANP